MYQRKDGGYDFLCSREVVMFNESFGTTHFVSLTVPVLHELEERRTDHRQELSNL